MKDSCGRLGDRLQGQAVQGRQLPGDAVVAPQVGAVGHGFVVDLQNDVVQIQRVRQRRTGGGVKGAEVEDVRPPPSAGNRSARPISTAPQIMP